MAKHKKHDEPEPDPMTEPAPEPTEGFAAFDATEPAPPEPASDHGKFSSTDRPVEYDKGEGHTANPYHEYAPKRHHKPHDHAPGLAFVRAGGQLVNLAHVVSVSLPVEGDPKQPLMLRLVTGVNLSLTGEDAECVLAALEGCCGE